MSEHALFNISTMKLKKAKLSKLTTGKPDAAVLTFHKLIPHLPQLIYKQLIKLDRLHNKFGDYLIIKPKGFDEIALTCNPDVIAHVLKENEKNYHRKEMMEVLTPFLGEGIFLSEEENWEKQRTIMKPAFLESQLRSFESAIIEETNKFIRDLEYFSTQNIFFNADDVSNIFLFRIIEKTLLHKNSKLDHKKINSRLQKLLHEASIQQQVKRHIKKSLLKPFGIKYDFRKAIREQMPELEEAAKYLINLSINDSENAGAMMSILTQAYERGEINFQNIRDAVMTFFFAAFDTTGEGFKWCLYSLAKYKQEMEIVREELRSSSLTTDVLKINSLKNFLNEVLRMYPPVWGVPRLALIDDEVNGIKIPKGTNIYINFFSLHRKKEFWNEPYNFSPQRFDVDRQPDLSRYYLPFGLGKRTCIGKRFALLQLSISLAAIIPKFNFELCEKKEPVFVPGVLLESKSPLYLKVKKIG